MEFLLGKLHCKTHGKTMEKSGFAPSPHLKTEMELFQPATRQRLEGVIEHLKRKEHQALLERASGGEIQTHTHIYIYTYTYIYTYIHIYINIIQ